MVAIVGRKVGTAAAQAAGRLQFTADAAAALANADVAWVTFDTPVDENDVPQVVAVVEPVKGFLPHVAPSAGICSTSCRNDQTVRPPVGKPQ